MQCLVAFREVAEDSEDEVEEVTVVEAAAAVVVVGVVEAVEAADVVRLEDITGLPQELDKGLDLILLHPAATAPATDKTLCACIKRDDRPLLYLIKVFGNCA